MAKKTVASKKRNVKVDAAGQLHVHSSFNNIIVCLANSEGQVISWSSAGKMGFRGSKKNTPYAAQMAAQDCAKVAYDLGLRKVKAYVKGPGNGRESAIRTIHGAGIEVTEIIDVTPLPHNGCRPPKRRRVYLFTAPLRYRFRFKFRYPLLKYLIQESGFIYEALTGDGNVKLIIILYHLSMVAAALTRLSRIDSPELAF